MQTQFLLAGTPANFDAAMSRLAQMHPDVAAPWLRLPDGWWCRIFRVNSASAMLELLPPKLSAKAVLVAAESCVVPQGLKPVELEFTVPDWRQLNDQFRRMLPSQFERQRYIRRAARDYRCLARLPGGETLRFQLSADRLWLTLLPPTVSDDKDEIFSHMPRDVDSGVLPRACRT